VIFSPTSRLFAITTFKNSGTASHSSFLPFSWKMNYPAASRRGIG
jgi:hypothetical protein